MSLVSGLFSFSFLFISKDTKILFLFLFEFAARIDRFGESLSIFYFLSL